MTTRFKPLTGWRITFYDYSDDWVYFADDQLFESPQAILDFLQTEKGQELNLGPSGLIFAHHERTPSQTLTRYFQTLRAANRFHKTLSRPA